MKCPHCGEDTKKETSEYGRGLTYCIGLFLAHQERYFEYKNKVKKSPELFKAWPSTWFNGAGDHLFELEIPTLWPTKLKKRLKKFKDKVIEWRTSLCDEKVTEKEVKWSLREAKDLLIEIDKFLGIKAIRGNCE